ncbi:MAG: indole-3-glycerol phosphate synthase TrpC [Pseudomonadota bacterium]|nr:indole-3-glycerol phosphate synthase TrpC [Pseudomonadota bacterium]
MSGTVLDRIVARKREEVAAAKRSRPLAQVEAALGGAPVPRGFADAMKRKVAAGSPAVIAEAKRASPSKGLLRDPFDPAAIAVAYERGGAACLSVLTDHHFFQGSADDLRAARAACALPVLRKDFMIDPYQVYEAREMGADCVLLIAAVLGDAQMRELHQVAVALGMDVLFEVHERAELERVCPLAPELLGINNRDLRNFETRLDTTIALLDGVPEGALVVSESGIGSAADVAWLRARGVDAFLVGEAFMRADDLAAQVRRLFFASEAVSPEP